METLASKVTAYKEALDALLLAQPGDYESCLRAVLDARDSVFWKIKKASHTDEKTFDQFDQVATQDKRLKEVAGRLIKAVGGGFFVDRREARQPPGDAWWWFLDQRVAEDEAKAREASKKKATLWILLTALCAGISIQLMAEITGRFVSEGNVSSIIKAVIEVPLKVLNAALALLALSTLTSPGSEWVEKLLTALGLFERYSFRKRFVVAATILLVVLGFMLSLPYIASYYAKLGAQYEQQNDLGNAVKYLKRAISLDPNNAGAHFELGVVYEKQNEDLRYTKAISEYSVALEIDYGFIDALINLTRLYIRSDDVKGLERALQNLTYQINRSPEAWDIKYALFKNRGWVYLRLGHYDQAEADLNGAIKIDLNRPGRTDTQHDRVAPHCLLGYTLEALHREAEAKNEWDTCARFFCSGEDLEREWADIAHERTGYDINCIE